ncbi:MAG: LysM peptidoglycan-binding domain-containing protein, partial [Nitrosomonadaceae bacterium]|nr:LysM peptidoglycan-binding domain-containing protein [Nitrosomonadaceae bacterium]
SYGIYLPAVSNRPYFAKVPAPDKIDVALAARLAEMDKDAFEQLNPAFNKPVAASGTGHFLVPIENADVFRENLELYQSLNGPLVSWVAVTAKRGEAVDAVARRHGMTASYLRATNGPFKERKGRFTQPATFMAPNAKDAEAIRQAFDRKVALKRETLYGVVTDGDDGPLQTKRPQFKTAAAVQSPRENLVRVATVAAPAAVPAPVPTAHTSSSADDGKSNAAQVVPTNSYAVERGDTLFSIAKRANIPLAELKSMNGLASNVVTAGRVLTLPEGTVMAPPSPRAALLAKPNAIAPVSSYVVRAGDTLFSIAKRFSTSVEALQRANRLATRATLRVGQRLVIQ